MFPPGGTAGEGLKGLVLAGFSRDVEWDFGIVFLSAGRQRFVEDPVNARQGDANGCTDHKSGLVGRIVGSRIA